MTIPFLSSKRSKIIAVVLLLAIGGGAVLLLRMRSRANPEKILARAESYFDDGDLESAKILYLKVLRSEPENAAAFSKVGMIWAEQGAPMTALVYLMQARKLGSEDPAARKKLAQSMLSLGDYASAQREAEAMLKANGNDDEALHLLASSARADDAEALAAAEQAVAGWAGSKTAFYHVATAILALRKDDRAGVEAAIEKALALEPESAHAIAFKGRLHAERGETEEAGRAFATAAKHAPRRSPLRLGPAEFKLRSGEIAEAREMLEEITSDVPDFIPAWLLMAKIAMNEGELDDALARLDNIFRMDPAFFPGRLLQSQALLSKGDGEAALESLRALREVKPFGDTPAVDYHLGQAYLLNARPDQAIDALGRAVQKDPGYIEANLLLARINLRSGKPEAVVSALTALLQIRPDLVPAELALADAYRLLDRLDDAAAIFRSQIAKNPEAARPQTFLGIILRQQGKAEEARAAFERANKLAPDDPTASRLLVEMSLEEGKLALEEGKAAAKAEETDLANEKMALAEEKFGAALSRVQAHVTNDPDSVDAHHLLGRIYVAQESWDKAEEALLRAIEIAPNSFLAYGLLIEVYEAAGKLDQAIEKVEARLAENPSELPSLMRAAKIYQAIEQPEKARDAYLKVLDAEPNAAGVYNNLAWIYSEQLGQLDLALEAAQKAWDAMPDMGAVADTLGWILYKRGDHRQALFHIRDASSKLPNDPEILFHLGMASYSMGETEAARDAMQRALATTTELPSEQMEEAQSLLALLDELTGELTIAELEARLGADRRDAILLIELGAALEREGDAEQAAATYEEALKVNTGMVAALTRLAKLYAGPLDDKEKALDYAERARKLAPDDPLLAGILGRNAYLDGNHDLAYSLLQESARGRGDDPAILSDFAWAAYALGKVQEARDTMQRVSGLQAEPPLALSAQEFLAMTVSDPTSLAPQAEKLLADEPDHVPALMVRVAGQMRSGDLAAVEETLGVVLRKYPKFAPAQKGMAAVLVERPDKLDEALDWATQARETLGEDRELRETLAAISYKKGNFAVAIRLLGADAEAGLLSTSSLFYLGMSYAKSGDEPKSSDYLQQALDAGLAGPHAVEANGVLEGIKKQP